MSSRISGTRQIRSSIRHIVFAGRIPYGAPVFMTITPSERHSGLAIHLFRGRRNDPAFSSAAQEDNDLVLSNRSMLPFAGYDSPSLIPPEDAKDYDFASVELLIPDLPGYDLRRLITARDPICCVHAFLVSCRVMFPSLFGFRM